MMTTPRSNGPKIDRRARAGRGRSRRWPPRGFSTGGFWVSGLRAHADGAEVGVGAVGVVGVVGVAGSTARPREPAVVGEESAVVAHLEDEVVERAVQGEAGVADELERAGVGGWCRTPRGGRGVRANLVQALVRRRGGGRANRRRRGRRRRRRAGIRDREADERRHGERARERDERARAAREDDAARRRSAGGDARDPSASRAQRQLSTHGARGRERRVRVGRSCARRPRSRTRSRLRSRPCRGATREAARRVPRRAPRSGRAPPTRDAEKDLRVQASRLPRRWASTPLLGRARSHVLCLGFPRSNGGFDRSESKPCARIRPIVPESSRSAPRGRSTNHVLPAHHAPRNHSALSSSRAADGAWLRERGRDIPASRATRDARRYRAGASLPARSRAGRPPRASVRVPHRPLTAPAPPLRSDRSPRRHSPGSSSVSTMSTCAALSSGARSLRASPAPCVKRAGARRGSPATTCRAAPAPRRDAARRVASATVGGIALASSLAPARAENLEGVAGDAASNAADAAAAQAAQAARAAADASAAVGDALGGVAGGAASVASSAADASRAAASPGRRRSRRRQRRRVLPRRRARRRRSPRVRRRRPRRRVGLGRRRRPRRRRRRRSGGAQPRRVRREGLRRG